MREVFTKKLPAGSFRTARVESLAVVDSNTGRPSNLSGYGAPQVKGSRLFVGTSDGYLSSYEYSADRNGTIKYDENLHKNSRDKKSISQILHIPSWGILLCIIDGVLSAYLPSSLALVTSLPDQRGVTSFSVDEASATLILVAPKKRVTHFLWQQSTRNFIHRRDFNLSDTPKAVYTLPGGATMILGYRRHYELLNLDDGNTTKFLDIDREHRLNIVELPPLPPSPPAMSQANCLNGQPERRYLLSTGTKGAIFNESSLAAGAIHSPSVTLEWAAVPSSTSVVLRPFLVTALVDGTIEVHDLASRVSLQRIPCAPTPSTGFVSLAVSSMVNAISSSLHVEDFTQPAAGSSASMAASYQVVVCTGDSLMTLALRPIETQVAELQREGQHDAAIELASACDSVSCLRGGVDLRSLYASSAEALLVKGDFERAMRHFAEARTPFISVLRRFPDLVPVYFHQPFNIGSTINGAAIPKLPPSRLMIVARALAEFLEFHRAEVISEAIQAEKKRDDGIIGSMLSPSHNTNEQYGDEAGSEVNRVDRVLVARLLDSSLFLCYMNAASTDATRHRRDKVISLLSDRRTPNFCHIESCAAVLAAHGNSYTEALLWLYRSQGQHSAVLQAMREEKCVAVGAWERPAFFQWAAEYLQWLWYHDDKQLPPQALAHLGPLLAYDAELGLCVLVCRPPGKTSFGGKGVTIPDVLNFFRTTSPRINYERTTGNSMLGVTDSTGLSSTSDSRIEAILRSIPLVNGHALGVAFLECLVSSEEAPPSMHNDFAALLYQGLPNPLTIASQNLPIDLNLNQLDPSPNDSEDIVLYKVYRRKLQYFLRQSTLYEPTKLQTIISDEFLHERALLFARQNNHSEVLKIYIHHLQNLSLAESYCDAIYTSYVTGGGSETDRSFSSGHNDKQNIYLLLFDAILSLQPTVEFPEPMSLVFSLATKFGTRISPLEFVERLKRIDSNIPFAPLVPALLRSLESLESRQRSLQIAHQLARTREVNLRTK